MNFYKHHLGDYMKRTQFLSMAQHGAYRLMIDFCYINESPLPKEKRKVYEICKAATKTQKRDVDSVLDNKWELKEDGYHNDRIDQEIEIYKEKAETNKINGNLGGRPKRTQTVSQTITQTKPNDNLSQNPVTNNQNPDKSSSAVNLAVALRSKGLKVNASNPDVMTLAESGVTQSTALEAVRIAQEDRGKEHPSIRYLIPIINELNSKSPPKRSATMGAIMALEAMKNEQS